MSAAKRKGISLPSLKEQAETKETLGINTLNDDCLTHIIQYLPNIVDRVRIERVCKRWLAISRDSWRDFKNLYFTNECWGFNDPNKLTEVDHRIVKKILNRCGKFLILIEFSQTNERLGPNVLKSVARFCPNIQHLDVRRLEISHRSWITLSENCNKLVSFAVGNCTDCELSLLFENNKELKKLSVFNSSITGECLKKLNCYSIEFITFVSCPLMVPDNFHVVRGFCKLKQLCLVDFSYLNDSFTQDISSCYKSLKYLTMMFGCWGSSQYITKLRNLQSLNLSSNYSVDDELLILIGANCRLLKQVDISYCHGVTNTGLASIVSLPNLEYLFVENVGTINDQVFRAMPTLREMDCSSCENLRDAGLIRLIEASENLEHLFLSYCENISNELLEAAIKATKKRKNHVALKLHMSNMDVKRLMTSNTSPFLSIFWTIIDRSSRIDGADGPHVGQSVLWGTETTDT